MTELPNGVGQPRVSAGITLGESQQAGPGNKRNPATARPIKAGDSGSPSSCAGTANALRQAALVQGEGKIVARGRRKTGQTVTQLKHERSGGQRQL